MISKYLLLYGAAFVLFIGSILFIANLDQDVYAKHIPSAGGMESREQSMSNGTITGTPIEFYSREWCPIFTGCTSVNDFDMLPAADVILVIVGHGQNAGEVFTFDESGCFGPYCVQMLEVVSVYSIEQGAPPISAVGIIK